MPTTKETWMNIIEQLKLLPGNNCFDINAGATESELVTLEQTLDVTLPHSFKEYLSVMNGQQSLFDNSLVGYMNFLSVEQIIERWEMMVDDFDGEAKEWKDEDKIKAVIWDKGWIPFAANMGGNNMMVLDMAPGKNGTVGQIFLWHPGMGNEDEMTAGSFEECSNGLLRRLAGKEYSITDSGIIEFNDGYFV